MNTIEIINLVAMIILAAVTGGLLSVLFQYLKKWIPANDGLRVLCVWVLCVAVGIAESWLAGDVLGILTLFETGGLTAAVVFAYGQGIFAAATGWYNLYVRPKALATANV